jgi:hypothetical protein
MITKEGYLESEVTTLTTGSVFPAKARRTLDDICAFCNALQDRVAELEGQAAPEPEAATEPEKDVVETEKEKTDEE